MKDGNDSTKKKQTCQLATDLQEYFRPYQRPMNRFLSQYKCGKIRWWRGRAAKSTSRRWKTLIGSPELWKVGREGKSTSRGESMLVISDTKTFSSEKMSFGQQRHWPSQQHVRFRSEKGRDKRVIEQSANHRRHLKSICTRFIREKQIWIVESPGAEKLTPKKVQQKQWHKTHRSESHERLSVKCWQNRTKKKLHHTSNAFITSALILCSLLLHLENCTK